MLERWWDYAPAAEGLEIEARESRKGLWADPQSVPPWFTGKEIANYLTAKYIHFHHSALSPDWRHHLDVEVSGIGLMFQFLHGMISAYATAT